MEDNDYQSQNQFGEDGIGEVADTTRNLIVHQTLSVDNEENLSDDDDPAHSANMFPKDDETLLSHVNLMKK